ncbi:Vacuolar protein sorting-associated protein 16-like protein [Armadillidium nasatum]|uniref:Vacuolar protein sorting-associated protein 16 homolog n=1 Tax=Armadillidium nasatum TaxID=96803 RepID=A0A5N5SX49_9CRUS|nr:Vacuolar protein sorting-associated protein 16-like protein [Armadillidium nasatum]
MALVSDWIQLGSEIFYRKPELYSMGWDKRLNLEDFIVAAAPLGGPIALTIIETKAVHQSKSLIFIFSASGTQITSFKWTNGSLVFIGWSRNEDLVCVQEQGDVLIYDMFGNYQHTFNFGQEVKDSFVKEAQIFTSFQDTGLAVLTRANRIFVVNSIQEPKARKYVEIPGNPDSPVLSWALIREERQTNVIASRESRLFLLDYQEHMALPQNICWAGGDERVFAISISSNYRHIALYTEKGNLWIGSSDLSTKYCECGTGAVVLLWDMTLEIISVNGESTIMYLDSRSSLVQEIDSVRIISSTTHDILHKVPRVMVETMGIGSMSPGALLLEASQGYQEGSTRATDCLGMIKETLEEAVTQCYQSAQHEFNQSIQKALLRAALFGKTFVPNMDPEPCKSVTTTLRILNAVRNQRVGIPITWNQLEWMTVSVLLDRLVLRRLFPLAFKIATYLKLPDAEGTSRVLAHWACFKVKQPSQKGDDRIAQEVNAKLGYTPGISYTDIANKAEQVGRKSLAIKLIEYECRPSKQVPVLLRLGEDQGALKKALNSGDADLIHAVLFHLRNKMALADFLMLIRNFPAAMSLHIKSCKESDIDQLKDIFNQEDDFYNQALLKISEAFDAKRIDSQLVSLQGAGELFRKTKSDFNSQITEDQVKLIRAQIRLEENEQKSFVNKSLYDTMLQLIKDGQIKEAEKLKADFKVPDKRYCYLRVYGHAEANHWNELNAFSKNKKLVIGFEPFVDACVKFGSTTEAQKYLSRVKEENKITYFLKCDLVEEAFRLAQELRSASALQEVSSSCRTNQFLQNKIQLIPLSYT